MTQTRINELGEHIRSLDQWSQIGFGRIEALARIAVRAMEAPRPHDCLEDFAQLFEVIEEIAGATMNSINSEAERAGNFHFSDKAQDARSNARQAGKQAKGGQA
jgi:hypothetical protein